MYKCSQRSSTLPTSSLQDDVIAHVLGPERRVRVRGLGFRVTPSKVNAHQQKSEIEKFLQDKVHNFTQELNYTTSRMQKLEEVMQIMVSVNIFF